MVEIFMNNHTAKIPILFENSNKIGMRLKLFILLISLFSVDINAQVISGKVL